MNATSSKKSRREFLGQLAAVSAATSLTPLALEAAPAKWQPRYIIGSSMYGYKPLKEILPEITKAGSKSIDIWPKSHGNQREQLEEMGEQAFRSLLGKHEVTLGCITQYHLGPFGIQEEMRLAKRLGCTTIVCGAKGPHGLKGAELKSAVATFMEQMKPHLAVAEETGVTIAIENHARSLIETPDSMKYLRDLRPSKHLAIGLAPYHLPQDEKLIAQLIRDLDGCLEMFYAWQHGNGCHMKQPKEKELLQMPGRGPLNFRPLFAALSEIKYNRWTEIFMHPFPRGIPILETVAEVTEEINRARTYVDHCLGAR
ncbi:MAG: TIM barrel protein [Pirellulaceae bacterium]